METQPESVVQRAPQAGLVHENSAAPSAPRDDVTSPSASGRLSPDAGVRDGVRGRRDGRELIDATRPFIEVSRLASWRHLLTTAALMGVFCALAALLPQVWARMAASTVLGLLVVRMFIIYHDFFHGAILKDSAVAKTFLSLFGMLVLAPPSVWRETHNYHHAHTAQIIGSHIGSFPVVTVEMWKKMSARDRLKYRVVRHPLTILLGYVPIFMIGMCVNSLRKSVRKYPDSAVALLLNWILTAALIVQFGFLTTFFTYLFPLMLATAAGGYLFYAQHNYPDMRLRPRQDWTFSGAALESSSYMRMGPVMQWFTGNIGYHHVHHLNSQIPFYRLPETMSAIAELQHPGVTTLGFSDIRRCLALKLWDAEQKTMVGYP